MRNTSIIKSRFFIAGTGQRLTRDHGREVAFTAIYLTACPHSHMAGIYYLSPGMAANELHITEGRFLADVEILEREGFCRYDRNACVIWIRSMMGHQVSSAWKAGDTRMKTIRLHLEALPDTPLILEFQRHYRLLPDGAWHGASDGACDGGADAGPNPLPVPKPHPLSPQGAPSRKNDFPAQDKNGLDLGVMR
ncbi:hypothetical protein [Thiocystis violascens]|uniref:Uncharacterized protein n=1 Tax=Thiocystis violascens (strain ATCC 17096 / DSM 198 / 6111) TaxID=765911 RepID=I3YHD6_THIV6|nr:hypothetical protein [Thiocystis violascens]AFL76404.1 hypothetical protein Thivi_4613 [Thiocystis violascens DSM 198]